MKKTIKKDGAKDTKKDKKSNVGILFEDRNNVSFNMYEVVLIVFISIVFGVIVGFVLTYRRNPVSGKKISKDLQEFITVYDNIKDNYYAGVDGSKLLESAVSGMIGSLDDPYTTYLSGDSAEVFNESIQGYYVGIGASIKIEEDGGNTIAEVYENSNADKAGLQVGDKVIKVDDKDVTKLNSSELSKLVRGKSGTTVSITVLRNDLEKTFKIKRKIVYLQYASSKIFEKDNAKIGYLKITSFTSNIYEQVNKQILSLEKKGIDSLIIDVRNNPGGHLAQVSKILDLFFNKKTVLYQIETKNKKQKVYASTNDTRTYPVVILVNSASASASEILAACFKDNYKKVTIVGNTTYGKGTIQKSLNLSTGASIKYTSQKWLTPKGKWIDNKGVVPDQEVFLNGDYYDNPTDDTDTQLQKAIELLMK